MSHFGPSIHKTHSDISDGLIPLDGTSAGLFFPWQCFHLVAGTSCLISFTRCWTNCFHSLSSPLIQHNVTLESVQQVISVISTSGFKASPTCVISLARTKAARSSNLGIDSCFTGATLDFDATNLRYLPLVVVM